MGDDVASVVPAASRPGGGDGVETQRDGGVADGVVVELEAGRGRGDRDLEQQFGVPDRSAAEAGPVGIRFRQVAGMRLDHAVGEELDGAGADQRSRVPGPLLHRRLDLLADGPIGVELQ